MSKMEEMYVQICEKLRKEVGSSQALALIAEHLKSRCRGDITACMEVLDPTHTLQNAYKAIEDEAYRRYQKDRKQKGICITRQEGYDIVDKYYGIVPTTNSETNEERASAAPTAGKVVSLFDMF